MANAERNVTVFEKYLNPKTGLLGLFWVAAHQNLTNEEKQKINKIDFNDVESLMNNFKQDVTLTFDKVPKMEMEQFTYCINIKLAEGIQKGLGVQLDYAKLKLDEVEKHLDGRKRKNKEQLSVIRKMNRIVKYDNFESSSVSTDSSFEYPYTRPRDPIISEPRSSNGISDIGRLDQTTPIPLALPISPPTPPPPTPPPPTPPPPTPPSSMNFSPGENVLVIPVPSNSTSSSEVSVAPKRIRQIPNRQDENMLIDDDEFIRQIDRIAKTFPNTFDNIDKSVDNRRKKKSFTQPGTFDAENSSELVRGWDNTIDEQSLFEHQLQINNVTLLPTPPESPTSLPQHPTLPPQPPTPPPPIPPTPPPPIPPTPPPPIPPTPPPPIPPTPPPPIPPPPTPPPATSPEERVPLIPIPPTSTSSSEVSDLPNRRRRKIPNRLDENIYIDDDVFRRQIKKIVKAPPNVAERLAKRLDNLGKKTIFTLPGRFDAQNSNAFMRFWRDRINALTRGAIRSPTPSPPPTPPPPPPPPTPPPPTPPSPGPEIKKYLIDGIYYDFFSRQDLFNKLKEMGGKDKALEFETVVPIFNSNRYGAVRVFMLLLEMCDDGYVELDQDGWLTSIYIRLLREDYEGKYEYFAYHRPSSSVGDD